MSGKEVVVKIGQLSSMVVKKDYSIEFDSPLLCHYKLKYTYL